MKALYGILLKMEIDGLVSKLDWFWNGLRYKKSS
jgi:hypothetical protein